MTPRFNFAPFSSAQSTLLQGASGYFILNGVVYGLLVAAQLIGYVFGREPFAPTILNVLAILIEVIATVGLVWTGLQLGRGTRRGGLLALGFVLLPMVFSALSLQPIDAFDIVFAVLGLIVLSAIWRELK
jgi:hypothetical protein